MALLYIFNTYSIPMLSASAGPDWAGIVAGLLFTSLGLLSTAETKRGPAVVGSLTVTGIGFAILLGQLDAVGVLVAGSFGTWTLYNVQFAVIVACFLFGVVIYAEGR